MVGDTLYDKAVTKYYDERVLEKIGMRTPTQTGNILAAMYSYRSIIKGQWCYGIFTAERSQ